MNRQLLETYSDYLMSSFSSGSCRTTVTGLSILVEGEISHDKVTRFLSTEDFGSSELGKLTKRKVREIESAEGVIIINDTIEEKPSTDENELVNWHYDHSKGRSVKGINIISALYLSQGVLYLVSSDQTLTCEETTTIYQKRWRVEVYHKSLKQHVSLCKSPTKRVGTQSNHIFASMYAFCKLEYLSVKSKLNPTALRSKIYLSANGAALNELENMKACFAMKF